MYGWSGIGVVVVVVVVVVGGLGNGSRSLELGGWVWIGSGVHGPGVVSFMDSWADLQPKVAIGWSSHVVVEGLSGEMGSCNQFWGGGSLCE